MLVCVLVCREKRLQWSMFLSSDLGHMQSSLPCAEPSRCVQLLCVCVLSHSLSLSLQKPCWIGYLTKSQLMTQAQPHCDKSFTIVSPLCVCERETVIHMLNHSQMMASTTLPGVQWQHSSGRVWSTRGAAPPSQSLHSRHHYDIIAITSL